MYVGNDFTDATPNENRRYTFDFSYDVDLSEKLVSATWTVECPVTLNPTTQDPTPNARKTGLASIDSTGKFCTQSVQNLLDGFTYLLRCIAITDQSATIELYSYVKCRDPG